MNCPKCGAPAAAGAAFCQQCGQQLAAAASGAASGAAAGARQVFTRRGVADVPEETLWEGSYSPKAMLGPAILVVVLSVVLLAVAALMLPLAIVGVAALWVGLGLLLLYKRAAIHYRLTNQRFFHESGILVRVTNRVEVIDIQDIQLSQGLVERMLGVGTIQILSSDVSNPTLVISGIDDVQQVFALMDGARRAERLRRGVSVESLG
jgi:membrane protein YdbS with pleckstrin-like domain